MLIARVLTRLFSFCQTFSWLPVPTSPHHISNNRIYKIRVYNAPSVEQNTVVLGIKTITDN